MCDCLSVSYTDFYIKREMLESSVSALQANESVARYAYVCVCVCLNVRLVVCAFGCVYALVSRSNQTIFLSQSCHHWNPFEVLPKQQVPPCALISSTHTHTHTPKTFSSPPKDRAHFPKVTPTCCPLASLTRSSLCNCYLTSGTDPLPANQYHCKSTH